MTQQKEEKQQHGCPYCDVEIIEAKLPFCQACGVPVFFCVKCGESVPRDSEVCPKCGEKIGEE